MTVSELITKLGQWQKKCEGDPPVELLVDDQVVPVERVGVLLAAERHAYEYEGRYYHGKIILAGKES